LSRIGFLKCLVMQSRGAYLPNRNILPYFQLSVRLCPECLIETNTLAYYPRLIRPKKFFMTLGFNDQPGSNVSINYLLIFFKTVPILASPICLGAYSQNVLRTSCDHSFAMSVLSKDIHTFSVIILSVT